MVAESLVSRFLALRTWRGNGMRAPHKPLLALWAIGRCLNGEPRLTRFPHVDAALARLLRSFGPHRQAVHTEFPFWRMRKDEVWEVDRPEVVTLTSKGDAQRSSLKEHDIHGGLLADDYRAFREDPELARSVALSLIEAHFPDSYRDDLLTAVGIDDVGLAEQARRDPVLGDVRGEYEIGRRRKRHPGFRPAVLDVYGERCAVCAFGVRVAGRPAALEAAHIHWLKDAGPWDVSNGLSLCALHHRLFDRGAFALTGELEVQVSVRVDGPGAEESLGRFHGQRLRVLPRWERDRPDPRFADWHFREVFQRPARSA